MLRKINFSGRGIVASYSEFVLLLGVVFVLGLLVSDSGLIRDVLVKDDTVNNFVLDSNNRTCFDDYNSRFVMGDGRNANGFYNYDGFFCVVTKDRSLEEISRVTIHELSHLFVHDGYSHFCKTEVTR